MNQKLDNQFKYIIATFVAVSIPYFLFLYTEDYEMYRGVQAFSLLFIAVCTHGYLQHFNFSKWQSVTLIILSAFPFTSVPTISTLFFAWSARKEQEKINVTSSLHALIFLPLGTLGIFILSRWIYPTVTSPEILDLVRIFIGLFLVWLVLKQNTTSNFYLVLISTFFISFLAFAI